MVPEDLEHLELLDPLVILVIQGILQCQEFRWILYFQRVQWVLEVP
jgi:hypothetical protein